ncbi:MAG: SpoIIIAH-like family protein [Halanaerobiaceae bacterium]
MILRRKVVWMLILTIWVGMVTSIIVYQGNGYYELEEVTTEGVDISENVEVAEQGVEEDTYTTNQVNYREAKNENVEEKDFFIEYRLERDNARSEQINIYRDLINNPNTDKIIKKDAQEKMLSLTEKMEKEMEIESLIRARGYKDALAYIHDGAVDVIIHTNGLEKEDVAQVGDIIVKVTGFNTEDVTIIEKKIEK